VLESYIAKTPTKSNKRKPGSAMWEAEAEAGEAGGLAYMSTPRTPSGRMDGGVRGDGASGISPSHYDNHF
jgi:hypothetical protein